MNSLMICCFSSLDYPQVKAGGTIAHRVVVDHALSYPPVKAGGPMEAPDP
ncbi:MAG: hypothetical protein QM820_08115 [Minicystis sp.]